jgi:hypothetical protein
MSGMKNGGVMDTSAGMSLEQGGKHFVLAKVVHWMFTKDAAAVVKVCMQGPYTIYFVENPQ